MPAANRSGRVYIVYWVWKPPKLQPFRPTRAPSTPQFFVSSLCRSSRSSVCGRPPRDGTAPRPGVQDEPKPARERPGDEALEQPHHLLGDRPEGAAAAEAPTAE